MAATGNSAIQFKNHSSACPDCGEAISLPPQEIQWCKRCEWNLDPQDRESLSLYDKIYRSIGTHFSEQLFFDLKDLKSRRPRWSLSKALTLGISTIVHASSIILLAAGTWAIQFWPKPFAMIFTIGCYGSAWLSFPKRRKLPNNTLSREKAPELYNLFDRVADAMGTSRVSSISISADFNAFYTELGFGPSRKKIISLGLPMVSLFNDQELVAVIAHETAHGANRDVLRGRFVGTAINSLCLWHDTCKPSSLLEDANRFFLGALFAVPVNFVRLVISAVPYGLVYILTRLNLRDSQEAEYLADRYGAEVSGTEAFISTHNKVISREPFMIACQKVSLSNGKDFFAELNQAHSRITEYEFERLTRIERRRGLSLDATHPPLSYRSELLNADPIRQPKVVITPEQSEQIHRELETQKDRVIAQIVDSYNSGLYYGWRPDDD